MTSRVVVLAHATDRTGPPMFLLPFLRRLLDTPVEVTVVALRGGELLESFRELADVRVVGEPVDPAADELLRASEPDRVRARRGQLADLTDLDLVLVNTAWSIHALEWLPPGDHEVVSIIHELSAGVADLLGSEELERLLASDRFVVGCQAVQQMLTTLGVEPARTVLVPYGIELEVDRAVLTRHALHATTEDFVVVAAAVPDRRKGPDLFVQLAACARERRPEIPWAFRWIGADDDDPRLTDARTDRVLFDAVSLVRFLPPTPRLRALLGVADVFVLTSRQDAFPLAALEAAEAGLPVLCFDTGGMTELVEGGAGAAVPFPDLDLMAERLCEWHDDPELRARQGAAGRRLVHSDHDAGVRADELIRELGLG